MQLPKVRDYAHREEYISKLAPALFQDFPPDFCFRGSGVQDFIYRAGLLFDELHALSAQAIEAGPGTTVDWRRLHYVETHAPGILSKFERPGHPPELVAQAVALAGSFFDGINDLQLRTEKAATEAASQLSREVAKEERAMLYTSSYHKALGVRHGAMSMSPEERRAAKAEDERLAAWIMDASAVKPPDVAARHAALVARYYPESTPPAQSVSTPVDFGL
jgi:hypothetical protein